MNGGYQTHRGRLLIGVLAAALLAVVIGVAAYNAGVSHGLAQQIAVSVPGAYPYPWPRPWGFGFGFFFPLLFGFLLLRLLFWGGYGHRRCRRGPGFYGAGPYDVPPGFDEWHRRAHERGPQDPSATSE
ncbi:MAG: hypothetical protein DMF77_03455 [Acidobacteria bacterium]|nr:MAG: hypothetical protein DMF77_03455 [Acidobacteriota bacterium]